MGLIESEHSEKRVCYVTNVLVVLDFGVVVTP